MRLECRRFVPMDTSGAIASCVGVECVRALRPLVVPAGAWTLFSVSSLVSALVLTLSGECDGSVLGSVAGYCVLPETVIAVMYVTLPL